MTQLYERDFRGIQPDELEIKNKVASSFVQRTDLPAFGGGVQVGDVLVIEKGRLSHGLLAIGSDNKILAGQNLHFKNLWCTKDNLVYHPQDDPLHSQKPTLNLAADWNKGIILFESDSYRDIYYEKPTAVYKLHFPNRRLENAQSTYSLSKNLESVCAHMLGVSTVGIVTGTCTIIYQDGIKYMDNMLLPTAGLIASWFSLLYGAHKAGNWAQESLQTIGEEVMNVEPRWGNFFPLRGVHSEKPPPVF